ncbi:MAG TPA: alanine racemase [Aestuariivirgaceae bacterium]
MTSPAGRAGGVLSIDLKALQQNYRSVGKQVAPAECGASVKANAYGIGMEPAARALWAAGCRSFFVALPEEGRKLRGILSDAVIYVLGGLFSEEAPFYAQHGLRPALSQMREVEEWAGWCRAQGTRLAAALHIESGINRLGLQAAQIRKLAAGDLLRCFELSLVLSHLARADEGEDAYNETQLHAFQKLRQILPPARASLANSPGAFLPAAYHFDLVRPGIALYGGNPFSTRQNPFLPVAQIEARVLQVKQIAKGDSVGYGGSWVARRATRLAVIAAGYADGYPRGCSSTPEGGPARVWIRGEFAPIVGRVSMDMITADVTDVAGDLQQGEMAELMGAHVTVDEIASWSGSLAYEILTRLGQRYLRLYSSFDS